MLTTEHEFKIGKYIVSVQEYIFANGRKTKEYSVFNEHNNLLCTLDAKYAEDVADTLLEVIIDKNI